MGGFDGGGQSDQMSFDRNPHNEQLARRARLEKLSPQQRQRLVNLLEMSRPTGGVREGENVRLAANLVARSGDRLEDAELRRFLKTKLPEYMVPSRFAWLEAMPLSPNGKVDRARLPRAAAAPELERPDSSQADHLERRLMGIWREVLGVDGIRSQDSFFDLGGHSLMAIQVISRVREAFGIELPLRSLFEQATFAEFSQMVRDITAQSAEKSPLRD